jgi:hypothetical protein
MVNNQCFIFDTTPDDGTNVYQNMSCLWVNIFYEHFIKSAHVLVSYSTVLHASNSGSQPDILM